MRSNTIENPRTMLSWTNAVALALEAQGVKSRKIFERVNIPYPSTVDASDRIESQKASLLLQLAAEETEDPAFGLRLVPYLHVANFQALGHALFCSSTLHEFCLRLVRFFRLVSEGTQHQLEDEEDRFKLSLEILSEAICDEVVDAWMGTIVQFCRSLYLPDFSPLRVELLRSLPACGSGPFDLFFSAPVVFSAKENALYFDKRDMFVSLPTASKELARRNDEVLIHHLARLDRSDLVRQIEARIVELLPTGECSRDKIASHLNMSPRKLLNKLEQRNTSYKEILENLRSNLAQQYIEQKDMPITEITFLLGFSDTSSFSRAFRRWTGKTPSDFRV